MLQMQEQIKESLLELRQAHQLQWYLSVRLAALEPKIDSVPVSHSTNLYLFHICKNNVFFTSYSVLNEGITL